jgi:hypothetical protein
MEWNKLDNKSKWFINWKISLGGAGTQTSALGFGGNTPKTNVTEEWTGPGAPLTQTITTS